MPGFADIDLGRLVLAPASRNTVAVSIERFGSGPTSPFVSTISVNTLAAAQALTATPLGAADAPVRQGTLTLSVGRRIYLGGGNFSFSGGSAPPVDIIIYATNNSLVGLCDAINRADAGITASIVSNAGSSILSLGAAEGRDRAFILSAAAAPGHTGLSRFAYVPDTRPMTLVSASADADLNVDGIAVTRSTNVIDDLVTGVRITARKADPLTPVPLSAAVDGAALSSTMWGFAATLGAMRSLIDDLRKGASGSDLAGALANDAAVRATDQRIAGLVSAPVAAANGLRLRDLGVDITCTGTIEFDAARFAALSPTRYADAEALLKTLALPSLFTQPNPLQSIAELAAPASPGLARQRSLVTSDLAKVDIRLTSYRTSLTRQSAAMDRLVAASNAVKEQLDQQIAWWSKRDN